MPRYDIPNAPISTQRNTINAPLTAARDAYQLAVLRGYVGTLDEWLASLQGLTAYQQYLAGTTDNPPLTEQQWLIYRKPVHRGPTPPENPYDGMEWKNTTTGGWFIFHTDINAWVETLGSEFPAGMVNIDGGKPSSVYTGSNSIYGGKP